MMHILPDFFKETKGKIVVSIIIDKRVLEYLTETHDVLKWFYDNYQRIDEYDYKKTKNKMYKHIYQLKIYYHV